MVTKTRWDREERAPKSAEPSGNGTVVHAVVCEREGLFIKAPYSASDLDSPWVRLTEKEQDLRWPNVGCRSRWSDMRNPQVVPKLVITTPGYPI